jgi:hypothetical protein
MIKCKKCPKNIQLISIIDNLELEVICLLCGKKYIYYYEIIDDKITFLEKTND